MDEQSVNQKQQDSQKVIEKYYIEVAPSKMGKFLTGIVGGLGYGIGITLGTAAFLIIVGLLVSKVNFVPIFGNFLTDVIKSAQGNLTTQ